MYARSIASSEGFGATRLETSVSLFLSFTRSGRDDELIVPLLAVFLGLQFLRYAVPAKEEKDKGMPKE